MEDIDAAFVDPSINRDHQKRKGDDNNNERKVKRGYVLTPFICVFSI
jgi:hypothetical protein